MLAALCQCEAKQFLIYANLVGKLKANQVS